MGIILITLTELDLSLTCKTSAILPFCQSPIAGEVGYWVRLAEFVVHVQRSAVRGYSPIPSSKKKLTYLQTSSSD